MELIFFVVFLGIVQGLTEFLPVSSSGHLALFENITWFQSYTKQLESQISILGFNVILHIGTLLAVIIFYRKDVINLPLSLIKNIANLDFKTPEFKMNMLILVATLPVFTVPLYKKYVDSATHSLTWLGFLFILNGFILIVSDAIVLRKKSRDEAALKDLPQLSYLGALGVGAMQCLAVFPGISRSGSTISGSLFAGLKGETAVRFSFLMSIPVLLGAIILEGKDAVKAGGNLDFTLLAIGLVFSFLAGLFSLKALVYLGRKLILYPFGIYTIILGILCLVVLR